MLSLRPKNKLSKAALLVALITLMTRIGYFMSLPFLSIYLAQEKILTPGEIGLILGISGLFYSVTSLLSGIHIEHRSKKIILMISLFLAGFSYLGIIFSMKFFWGLFFLNASLGWLRALSDVSAVTLLVKNSDESSLRKGYGLRFSAMNLGAMVGPLIGAIFVSHQSLAIFGLAGIIHIGLGIFLYNFKIDEFSPPKADSKQFLENIQVLFKDKYLLNITFIQLIIWIIYSQLESTIPQYMTKTIAHPAIILSSMMVINAIMCVTLSAYALQVGEFYSKKKVGMLGSVLLLVGFLLIAIFPSPTVFIVAIIIISVGELLTMPLNGLLIAKLAPKQLVASYNGFFNFSAIGLSIGPIVGGFGLQYLGGKVTLFFLALLPLICFLRYQSSDNSPVS